MVVGGPALNNMPTKSIAGKTMVRYFRGGTCQTRHHPSMPLHPGLDGKQRIGTAFPDQVQDLIRNWHKRGWTPMGRLGTPEDIADAVTLFCSEQARSILRASHLCGWWRVTHDARKYHRKYSSGKDKSSLSHA